MKAKANTKKAVLLLLSVVMLVALLGGCDSSDDSATSCSTESGTTGVTSEMPLEATEAPKITFTLNISYSGGLYEDLMLDIVSKAAELSNGRIQGTIIASGTMGSEREVGESIQIGTLDMAYLSDNVAETLIGNLSWAWLPFMITSYEEADKYYNSGWIREKLWKLMEKGNLVGIAVCENGFRNYGNSVKLISSLEDFRGQKVRVPEQPDLLKFYNLCGALPVAISGSEVITALEQRTIDAVDNTVYNFHANGYIDSLRYITMTNHQYTSNNIIVSPTFWKSLSVKDQDILRQAAEYACKNYTETRRAGEAKIIQGYKGKGYTFIEPSPEFKAQLMGVARKVWSDVSGQYDAEIMERIMTDFGHKMQ